MLQTFLPDLLENTFFFHLEYFVSAEKDGNHLVQGLLNIVERVE